MSMLAWPDTETLIAARRAGFRPADASARMPAAPAAPAASSLAPPARRSVINLPNVITLAGFFATLAWLGGASPGWALLGLLADEIDGRVARATGQTSEFGSLLDWTTDVTLTALVMQRLEILWALPPVTAAQVALRKDGWRPPVGSARAVLTLWALYRENIARARPPGTGMREALQSLPPRA